MAPRANREAARACAAGDFLARAVGRSPNIARNQDENVIVNGPQTPVGRTEIMNVDPPVRNPFELGEQPVITFEHEPREL